jgi:hypothetical protein
MTVASSFAAVAIPFGSAAAVACPQSSDHAKLPAPRATRTSDHGQLR